METEGAKEQGVAEGPSGAMGKVKEMLKWIMAGDRKIRGKFEIKG